MDTLLSVIDWSPRGVFTAFGLFWLAIITPVSFYWCVIRSHPRPKPDGYVGKFRKPDGAIVHVSRVNGLLMVISEEKPGVMPRDLGNVSGLEIWDWHKLSSTPDGNERVARSD